MSTSINVSTEVLSKIADGIGSVAGSLHGLCQLLECGETTSDRLSHLVEIHYKSLSNDYAEMLDLLESVEVAL